MFIHSWASSAAQLQLCSVMIDESTGVGVLFRITDTARRAVTWHHADDVSLHRMQYQNLFHRGHGASATRNIFFLRTIRAQNLDTRLTVNLPPPRQARARPPRASRPTGTASVTPACAAVAAGICHVKPPAPGGCFPGGKRRRRERRPRPAPRRRRRPRVTIPQPHNAIRHQSLKILDSRQTLSRYKCELDRLSVLRDVPTAYLLV